MPLTKKQKEDFAVHGFDTALEVAIDWIQDHLKPNEVFQIDDLRDWAGENSKPEEVFAEEDLKAWAEANGFVKEAS